MLPRLLDWSLMGVLLSFELWRLSKFVGNLVAKKGAKKEWKKERKIN